MEYSGPHVIVKGKCDGNIPTSPLRFAKNKKPGGGESLASWKRLNDSLHPKKFSRSHRVQAGIYLLTSMGEKRGKQWPKNRFCVVEEVFLQLMNSL